MLETARSRACWDPCFQVLIKPIIFSHRFYAYESLRSEISFCYFKLFKIPGKWRDWKHKVKQRHKLLNIDQKKKKRKKRTWSHVSCLYNTVLMGGKMKRRSSTMKLVIKKIWFVSKEPSSVLLVQISRTIILDWHYWLWTSHLAQDSWDCPHSKRYATPFEDFSSK